MCGPVDEKKKAKWEKFLDDFSSAYAETLHEQGGIFSQPVPSRILNGNQQTISSSALPKFRRNGNQGSKNKQLVH